MKALVTGATGFVGSHVAEKLCREGLEVLCLVRSTSRLDWLQGLKVETCVADLTGPPPGAAGCQIPDARCQIPDAGWIRV